jgi:hypothetical protein
VLHLLKMQLYQLSYINNYLGFWLHLHHHRLRPGLFVLSFLVLLGGLPFQLCYKRTELLILIFTYMPLDVFGPP